LNLLNFEAAMMAAHLFQLLFQVSFALLDPVEQRRLKAGALAVGS